VTTTKPTAASIDVRGLTITLDGPAPIVAVRDLDATIEPGELACVLGPSGCGKSTLLGALAGFIAPTAGAIIIDGEPVRGDRLRSDVGVVFQQPTLLPWKTVEDNVAFGLKVRGVGRRERRAAAHDLLAQMGLGDFARAYPAQLSGGMQQRVEIARVLITQPRIVLMDEPFGSLDAQTRLAMQELLLAIWARIGVTVVFVTHDIDEAIFLGDRILVMSPRPGRIREVLPVDFARPRKPELATTAQFAAIKRRCLGLLRDEPFVPTIAPALDERRSHVGH